MSGGAYERRDARFGPVMTFAIGLSVLCAAVFLLGRGLLTAFERRAERRDAAVHPMAIADTVPPGPRLQANPGEEYRAHHEAELEQARTYGWIDRQAGIVRVPIDRAMELVLEEGVR